MAETVGGISDGGCEGRAKLTICKPIGVLA